MFDWFKKATPAHTPVSRGAPSVGERIENLAEGWNLTSGEAARLRSGTTSHAVERALDDYETVVRLAAEGRLLPGEVDTLKEQILKDGGANLKWVLQGLAWIDEISSGDTERAWERLSALSAAEWLQEKYGIPVQSARRLWQTLSGMPEYALSETDRIQMRGEVATGGNSLYAATSARGYLLTAVMVYQHQAGSRLRPVEPAYASVFGFGGVSSKSRQVTAEEVAPWVLSGEEVAGLREHGYSLLDEDSWNRLIALLRTVWLNRDRIKDVAGLRGQILAATPEELASGHFDERLWQYVAWPFDWQRPSTQALSQQST